MISHTDDRKPTQVVEADDAKAEPTLADPLVVDPHRFLQRVFG